MTTVNNSSERRSEWVELKALKLQVQRFNRLATLPLLNFLLIQQLTSFSNCSFSCIKFATFCSRSPHCCLKVCSSITFCFNLYNKKRVVYKLHLHIKDMRSLTKYTYPPDSRNLFLTIKLISPPPTIVSISTVLLNTKCKQYYCTKTTVHVFSDYLHTVQTQRFGVR